MSEPARKLRTAPHASHGGGGGRRGSSSETRQVLTKDAVQRLSDGPTGLFKIRDKALILVQYGLACRVSEIAGLRHRGLDRERGRVRFWRPKTGDWHEVPLTASGWGALEAYLGWRRATEGVIEFPPDSHVFVSKSGRPLAPERIWTRYQIAGKNAGIPKEKSHPHVMRHSRITHLIEAGTNIETVREIAGHASISMTQSYIHIAEGDIDRAAWDCDL